MTFHKFIIRFFAALARYSIRRPARVIVIATVLTLAIAPGVLRLTLRTDGHALVSENAPEVIYDRSIRDAFGIEDWVVVLVRSDHAEGIFNPATLQLVRELTSEFSGIPQINPSNVVSLATEHSFRARPGSLYNQTFLETPLQTREECGRLRDDLRRIQLYTGTLVSFDGKATAILIGAPAGCDRTRLYRTVQGIITQRGSAAKDISITGAPVAEALLGIHILEDLGVPKALLGASTRAHSAAAPWRIPRSLYELRLTVSQRIGLVPIAILLMAIIFYISFRSMTATLLPMLEVGACLIFVFGLMGWVGVPIYLTIAVMPVLLTAMGVTEEIHVFHRYRTYLRERPRAEHPDLVATTMEELCCALVNTSLTTAIGFVAFAFSPVEPVRAFGIFTAVGVVFCLVWSLTVTPALLVLIRPARFLKASKIKEEISVESSWFARLAGAVVRKRYVVVAMVVLVAALTPFGLQRLAIQDSWIDGFDRPANSAAPHGW